MDATKQFVLYSCTSQGGKSNSINGNDCNRGHRFVLVDALMANLIFFFSIAAYRFFFVCEKQKAFSPQI